MIEAAQWNAFLRYLPEAARGRAELPCPAELERFLPYAAAFGISGPLLKQQQKRDGITLPAWFQAFQSADGSDSTAFVAFMTTCDSSATSSDGGSGGSSSGASGGGSSGAG